MTSDLLLCFSLWKHCCQFVFSRGRVKGGINPSCPSEGSHKQHNVTSLRCLNAWKFRKEKIFDSSLKTDGFLLVRDGADHLNKTIKNCSCAVPVKVTLCKKPATLRSTLRFQIPRLIAALSHFLLYLHAKLSWCTARLRTSPAGELPEYWPDVGLT